MILRTNLRFCISAQAFTLFITILSICGFSHAQTVKAELQLSDKPSGSTKGPPIPAGIAVKVVERQGFWVRIEVRGQSGWVKASGLSFSSGAGGPTAIDTGRLGTGNIVSTSAARGLSAKDLLNGTPRIEEVAKMIQFTPDKASLIAFGSQGNLVALAQTVSLNAAVPVVDKPVTPHTDGKRNSSNENLKSTEKKASDDW